MNIKGKNKDMATVESKANKGELQEFFFSGGLEYKPITVLARNRQEAEAEWERVREKAINN